MSHPGIELRASDKHSTKELFKQHVNPHQNDQGRKGPCYFQRLNALKCLKCQKI
jgi:hypothetical protein